MLRFGIEQRTISESLLAKSDQVSASAKAVWADQERRKRQSTKLKVIQAGRAAELSASARLNWAHNREQLIAGINSACTPERNLKVANASRLHWQDPEYRQTLSEKLSNLWDRPGFREKVISSIKKRWSDESFRLDMARRRKQPRRISGLQITLYALLLELGADFEPEGPATRIGRYYFDCLLRTKFRHILIECQGSYWHNLPIVVKRDQTKLDYIKNNHPEYEVVYIWEPEFCDLGSLNAKLLTLLDRPELT